MRKHRENLSYHPSAEEVFEFMKFQAEINNLDCSAFDDRYYREEAIDLLAAAIGEGCGEPVRKKDLVKYRYWKSVYTFIDLENLAGIHKFPTAAFGDVYFKHDVIDKISAKIY